MEDVQAYLAEERDFGAILGLFEEPPLQNIHISPFMAREKPESSKKHVMIDLSYPLGAFVNKGVSNDTDIGTDLILTLPSIDHVTNEICKLGKDCKIF